MDSRKCQTVTATPAKPGELPVGLGTQTGLTLGSVALLTFAGHVARCGGLQRQVHLRE
jgi:hypothetical protein